MNATSQSSQSSQSSPSLPSSNPARATPGKAVDSVGEKTLELFAASENYNRFLWTTLNSLAPSEGRVLEVGCGIGNITRRILGEPGVDSVHGIDMDPAYVDRMLAEVDHEGCSGTACAVEDFSQQNYPEVAADASYDRIVCSNVLEHIDDHVSAMKNFHRMLRPGGTVLLLVPAHRWLFCGLDRELSHFRRYIRADFLELERETGLELASCRHFNPLGILGWWLNGKVLGRSELPEGQMSAYSRFAIPVSKLVDRINPFPLGISILGAFRRPPA